MQFFEYWIVTYGKGQLLKLVRINILLDRALSRM